MGIKLSVVACKALCKIDYNKCNYQLKVLNAAHELYKEDQASS